MREKAIEIKRFSVNFDETKILKDVSLEVNKGEAIYFLGGNGSGKSTLFNSLTGRIKSSNELFKIRGKAVHHAQFPSLFSNMTVKENIQTYSLIFSDKISDSVIDEWIFKLGIKECGNKPIEKLSGGQRQRLALIISMIRKGDIYLFDEADSAMDPRGRQIFFELLVQLKKSGKTILWISHHVKESVEIADRCYLLKNLNMNEFCENDIAPEFYNYTEESFVEKIEDIVKDKTFKTKGNKEAV